MNRIRYSPVVFGLVVLLTGGITALAQETTAIPQITFANHSGAPFNPAVARLSEAVTLEDVAAADEGGEMRPIFEGKLSLLGVAGVMPERAVDVIFDFAPGTYVLVNTLNEEQLQSFTVVDGEGEGAAPPEAGVEVALVDFAFDMPIAIPAGSQLWHIQNPGAQPHEMLVAPLDDAMTVGEFNQVLMRAIAGEEVEGSEPVIFWAMSPGEQAWITYDLEPGTYAVVCGFPDTSDSGHVHLELGMRQIIIVTESLP